MAAAHLETLIIRFQSTPPMQGATITSVNAVISRPFQSTPPMQGATQEWVNVGMALKHVSIHAPYAGSDGGFPPVAPTGFWFQSTPPMQGATQTAVISSRFSQFQSTPPMQGATRIPVIYHCIFLVSIHAPYAGSDSNFSQKFFLIFSRNRQIIISNT